MGATVPSGSTLRRLRRREGVSQAALAGRLGISASYLNLIEHNQRKLTAPLAAKIADIYDIEASALAGGKEARLLADMGEIYSDPLFSHNLPAAGDLLDAVGQAPGLCETALTLYRAYSETRQTLLGFSEQLAHDPYFADSSHQLLTMLTSVRSFAEILQDNVELAAEQRKEFAGILVTESGRLTELINQLFEFIASDTGIRGGIGTRGGIGKSPADEVHDALQASSNHFPELEEAASAERAALRLATPGTPCQGTAKALLDHMRVRYDFDLQPMEAIGSTAAHGQNWHFDERQVVLRIAGILPPQSLQFRLAHVLGRLSQAALIGELRESAGLSTPEASRLYGTVLGNYFAAALLMPYEAVLEQAESRRYDIEQLAARFGVSFEQACHRLTTLQRPGAAGVPFHFLRSDIAGNITKRFSVSGLTLPRFGNVCPRWNLHTAFTRLGHVERQVVEFPDGGRFLFLARANAGPAASRVGTRSYHSVAIGCEISFAHRLVYADGLDLAAAGATPVGLSCRRCERDDCGQRVQLPALPRKAPKSGVQVPDGTVR